MIEIMQMNYYIEGERVCTKIGGHFSYAPTPPLNNPLPFISGDVTNFKKKLRIMVDRGIECSEFNPDYVTINPYMDVMHRKSMMLETNLYFYHPDHLGSSSFITDATGYATQHLQYLPFGETFVDQQNGYDSRYTFSAKEKDDETQYSYFGARYYDSDLSVWLSVDAMSDEYPELSPYCYVGNNPVNAIDPDGNKIILLFDGISVFSRNSIGRAIASKLNNQFFVNRKVDKAFNVKYVGYQNTIQFVNQTKAYNAQKRLTQKRDRLTARGRSTEAIDAALSFYDLVTGNTNNFQVVTEQSNQQASSNATNGSYIDKETIDNLNDRTVRKETADKVSSGIVEDIIQTISPTTTTQSGNSGNQNNSNSRNNPNQNRNNNPVQNPNRQPGFNPNSNENKDQKGDKIWH